MAELKYINKEQNKNLQIKDLITLGLYTILLVILMGVGVGLGTLFTSVVFGGKVYFATYTSVAAALVCGSAYSLIFNKIDKNMNKIYLKSVRLVYFLNFYEKNIKYKLNLN